jgi:hypothetical protein
MAKKKGEFAHRGRLQAQGGGTQEDEPWARVALRLIMNRNAAHRSNSPQKAA